MSSRGAQTAQSIGDHLGGDRSPAAATREADDHDLARSLITRMWIGQNIGTGLDLPATRTISRVGASSAPHCDRCRCR